MLSNILDLVEGIVIGMLLVAICILFTCSFAWLAFQFGIGI